VLDHHNSSPITGQFGQQGDSPGSSGRVELGEWFIEQQKRTASGDRTRDNELLLLSTRKVPW
jgi:hypothetical protein